MRHRKRIRLRLTSALICAVFLLSGCASIEEREPDIIVDTGAAPDYSQPALTAGNSLDKDPYGEDTRIEQNNPTTMEPGETVEGYTFTVSDEEFLAGCVFVGDSICKGLSAYGFIDYDRCFAEAGVAARDIFDFNFTYKEEKLELLTALVNSGAKNIVFSMGMNDVNMTDPEQFASDYDSLLSKVEAVLPDAELYVLSITPVTDESNFTYNETIDSFNAALEQLITDKEDSRRHYVDVSSGLKNGLGALKSVYCSSPDGVHLTDMAYYGILWQLCNER